MKVKNLKKKLEKDAKKAKDGDKPGKIAKDMEMTGKQADKAMKKVKTEQSVGNVAKRRALGMKSVEKGTKGVAKGTKPVKMVGKQPKTVRKEDTIMDHVQARKMALKVLASIAKSSKTHHLGRNGHWLIRDKSGEVEVGISKKGKTGLVKVTMPIEHLPQEAQRYGVKAVQAHHMTWLQFDAPEKVIRSAINARVKSTKTMYEFSEEVYDTTEAPCWQKAKGAKKSAAEKLADIKVQKDKLVAKEKMLKKELKKDKASKQKVKA